MSRPVAPAPVRIVSILLVIVIGSILAYAYQVNLPTLFFSLNVASLVVFVAIPLLAGFLVGLLNPSTGVRDGLLVGFLLGLINSVIATVKLIFEAFWETGEVYAFSLFALMSIFIWMILAGAAAELATKIYD